MATAIWNDVVIAESEDTVIVEGNHYFPVDSVRTELLKGSDTTSVCPWKGTASYYTVVVNGEENQDAAWYYPEPSEAARQIAGHIAFWRGVEVVV
ncbi:hypothetical protein AQ490_27175 [Wenjunlia vitaminophila]|uniref:DUF427 domain-containing protein n=1 Tax=Wenjunlia vitaminophila TaxID=76728 RepID=A0A0T6LQ46_WENVI|nr:DUF427 domain-containing protein [Wenjunlia vitaminophila]KRV48017.1 hypothetical protein AQ490_27175 [Wenjunlia vitaminophila]